ncbi:hypothetical protein ACGFX2_31935 [Streptomyces goshikiensis]
MLSRTATFAAPPTTDKGLLAKLEKSWPKDRQALVAFGRRART